MLLISNKYIFIKYAYMYMCLSHIILDKYKIKVINKYKYK